MAAPGANRAAGYQQATNERTMKIREGTRVLVTAGASGIGRRIAATFLGEGARVHVCDVSGDRAADLLQELPEVGFTQADVAVPADVERVFGDLAVHLGGLDVLINNAGIAGPTAPVEQVSPEDWRRTLDVNITGQFLCARLAVPLLKQAGGGSIVNLSSVAGRLGYPMRTPYAASKWAVVGFTQSLAMELGPHRIRVNALLPGMVEGDRIRSVIAAKAAATQKPYEELEGGAPEAGLASQNGEPRRDRQHGPLPLFGGGSRDHGSGPKRLRQRGANDLRGDSPAATRGSSKPRMRRQHLASRARYLGKE